MSAITLIYENIPYYTILCASVQGLIIILDQFIPINYDDHFTILPKIVMCYSREWIPFYMHKHVLVYFSSMNIRG